MTLKPDSVEAAAAVVVAALRPAVNSDWSARAGDLEWSVDRTIAHMTIEGCAAALAGIAATAPESAFGSHVSGMRTAHQFLSKL